MKITSVETFVVDAGWRPWLFGESGYRRGGWWGYGECSDCWSPQPHGIVGTIKDLTPLLLGQDPRPYERRVWDLLYSTRQSPGGIAAKAIAGIECALVDITAKALGISVVELFGGPDARAHPSLLVPLWHDQSTLTPIMSVRRRSTHWPTSRNWGGRWCSAVLRPSRRTWSSRASSRRRGSASWPALGSEVQGTDQIVTMPLLRHIERLIGTFRDAVGPDVDINLDLNFLFKPESATRIAQVVEQFDLLWLEVDMYDPAGIRQIKEATTTKICTGENLFHPREYLPYFEQRAADVFMVDVPWNGFSQSKRIGNLAELYQYNVAPHNYYSHLATFVAASLCAVLPNVRIMEVDVDDVPWKDELVTNRPEIVNGAMTVPTGSGWGTDLNEDVARAHPWGG